MTTSEPEPLLLSQHFDSAGMDDRAAFFGWREAVAPVFDIAPVDGDAPFAARYDTYHLGEILIGVGAIDATMFSRSAEKARMAGVDHVLVQVYTKSGYTGRFDGEPIVVGRDDLVTIDLTRVITTISAASENITLMIPRPLIEGYEVPHGHMSRDPQRAMMGRFLAEHLVAVRRALPTMPNSAGPIVAESILSLYRSALDPRGERTDVGDPHPSRSILLERARRLIDETLAEDVEIAWLASSLGVSRSKLYRMFEPFRGVASFVQERRLRHIRRALRDPKETDRIHVIAAHYGFHDASYFSRAFRRRFCVTPAQMRQAAHSAGDRDIGTDFDLRPWMNDLCS